MSISDAMDRVLPRLHALVVRPLLDFADPEMILPRVSGLS
jgi:hypothetical protein